MALKLLLVAGLGTLLFACDEATVSSGEGLSVRRPDTVKARVSNRGVSNMYDLAYSEGFKLEIPPTSFPFDGGVLSVGPVEDLAEVTSRTFASDPAVLRNRFQALRVLVPVRVQRGVEIEICRFSYSTSRLDLNAEVGLVESIPRPLLGLTGSVDLDQEPAEVREVVPCSLPLDTALETTTLEDAIKSNVEAGFIASATQNLGLSPLDLMGVLEGPQRISRLSPFDGRRGVFSADLRGDLNGVTLGDGGLSIDFELGLEATRARCVPPLSAPNLPSVPAGDISALDAASADFTLALSQSVLQEVANGLILSGFLCRGLDRELTLQSDPNALPTEILLLEEIGLQDLEFGEVSTLASRPGGLPTLSLDALAGLVEIQWQDFTIEAYSTFNGAKVQVFQLRSKAKVRLRPQNNTSGSVRLSVESLEVESAEVSSIWTDVPLNEQTENWARRLLVIALENAFVFPLPLVSTEAIRVQNVSVRPNDVLLQLVFD